MDEAESGIGAPQEAPQEKKSGKKKSPHQKRAETQAQREEWSDEKVADAFAAAGGVPKSQTPEPPKTGRKPKYQTIDLERVEMYAAGGLTKAEIAQALDIAESTLYQYEIDHPEFSEAIAKGRKRDVEEVENAVHRAAKGYTFIEDKIFYDSQVGKVVVQPTVKRIPPDIKAALAILLHAETKSWKPRSDVEMKFPETLVIRSQSTGQAIESLGVEKPKSDE